MPLDDVSVVACGDQITVRDGNEAREVAPGEPAAGWAPEPWAMWTGVHASTRPTLVFASGEARFVDAGVESVAGAVPASGLVAVQPFRIGRVTSSFTSLVPLMVMGTFTPTRRPPIAACGAVVACARDDYFEVGGHNAVRSERSADAALVRRFAATGRPVAMFGGEGVVEAATSLDDDGPRLLGVIAMSVNRPRPIAILIVWLWGCASAAWTMAFAASGRGGMVSAALAYLAYAGLMQWLLAKVGRFGVLSALAFPVGLCGLGVSLAYGLLKIRSR